MKDYPSTPKKGPAKKGPMPRKMPTVLTTPCSPSIKQPISSGQNNIQHPTSNSPFSPARKRSAPEALLSSHSQESQLAKRARMPTSTEDEKKNRRVTFALPSSAEQLVRPESHQRTPSTTVSLDTASSSPDNQLSSTVIDEMEAPALPTKVHELEEMLAHTNARFEELLEKHVRLNERYYEKDLENKTLQHQFQNMDESLLEDLERQFDEIKVLKRQLQEMGQENEGKDRQIEDLQSTVQEMKDVIEKQDKDKKASQLQIKEMRKELEEMKRRLKKTRVRVEGVLKEIDAEEYPCSDDDAKLHPNNLD